MYLPLAAITAASLFFSIVSFYLLHICEHLFSGIYIDSRLDSGLDFVFAFIYFTYLFTLNYEKAGLYLLIGWPQTVLLYFVYGYPNACHTFQVLI